MVISRVVYGFIVHLVTIRQANVVLGYKVLESETDKELGTLDPQEFSSRKFHAHGLEFGSYQNRQHCYWFGYCVASTASNSYDFPTIFTPVVPEPVTKFADQLNLGLEPRWYLVQEGQECCDLT